MPFRIANITRITQVTFEYINNTLLAYDIGFLFAHPQIFINLPIHKHRLNSSTHFGPEVLKLSSNNIS